jgi:RND family efflux transporter MFP subunit
VHAEAQAAYAAASEGSSIGIRAPVDGKLASIRVRPGDQVQPGDELFRIVDAAGLWMEARVPEQLASGIVAGSAATVEAAAFPGVSLDAVILDAGQEADPATGTMTVTLAVTAADHDLHPGMSATAWLGRGAIRDALVVPDGGVVDSGGMTIGFVKVGPEQFELRELRLGARSGESWEVLAGLNVGERVVTEGTYTLRSLAGR